MIAIIDYGMGNLRSVQKAFEHIGTEAVITDDPEKIRSADGVVLPGVGAFADALKAIDEKNLRAPILECIKEDRPFLGICLGMQLLFEYSEEGGKVEGFSVFKGGVKKLPASVKIPHMGWNTLTQIQSTSPFMDGVNSSARFYFVHSFYVDADNDNIICTTTDYGAKIVSSICVGNLFACQFHPEKSGDEGLKILRNFMEICNDNLSRD